MTGFFDSLKPGEPQLSRFIFLVPIRLCVPDKIYMNIKRIHCINTKRRSEMSIFSCIGKVNKNSFYDYFKIPPSYIDIIEDVIKGRK